MFYISKGDCTVNIRDENGKEQQALSILVAGDHFGEISLIYRCKRTATIVSRNYNNMAELSYEHYRQISMEFPKYGELLKDYTHTYNDSRKIFLSKVISKFEFLTDLPINLMNTFIYSLEAKIFEPN